MAPIKPRKASSRPAPRATVSRPQTSFPEPASAFSNNKRDKRIVKRSLLVNRIEKQHTKPKKRRRPNKQLVANLESLADALPDADDQSEKEVGQAKIKHRSLKSKPGALKRKAKLEQQEKLRFGVNMAQLVGTGGGNHGKSETNGTSNKWEQLRTFISSTMEQKEEFGKS